MEMTTKPDFAEAADRWEHFWDGELLKRPPVVASCPKNPPLPERDPGERYYYACTRQWERKLKAIDRELDSLLFLGEAIPQYHGDFGPDQWAAFLGAELEFSADSPDTNWVEPLVTDWNDALPLQLDESNPTFRGVLELTELLAKHSNGRYAVGQLDHHSNADTLSALRGPENLCMDLYDVPELVGRAMEDVRRMHRPIVEAVHRACSPALEYGSGRSLWHPRSFGFVQSDFICMMSPEMFREYVLPALEEEASVFEASAFHLDGPDALRHLDDILAIDDIDVLQWVSGAGQKANFRWVDVLQRCQAAGKAVQVYGGDDEPLDLDAIKFIHPQLDPAKVVYYANVADEQEFNGIAKWLEQSS